MSEEKKSETEEDSPSPGWLVLAAAVVIAVLIVFWLSVTNLISKPEQQGQFGDMFGAANTLFSGLAFAGIIYTIWLQRTELKLQRIELRDTKEELKLSRLAHEKTSKIMDKQLEILEKTLNIEQVRFDRQFLPIFVEGLCDFGCSIKDNKRTFELQMINKGNPVSNIVILNTFHSQDSTCKPIGVDFLDKDDVFDITGYLDIKSGSESRYSINYCTLDGRKWKTDLTLYISPSDRIRSHIGSTKIFEVKENTDV